MTLLKPPPWRIALRHPSVRAGLLLALLAPVWVGVIGTDADAGIRLRVLGFVLAAVAALSWDDRGHALCASTPVGLPAVRRGRGLVVVVLLAVAFVLGWLAVPASVEVPVAVVVLQSVAMAGVLLALVAWFGRDGDPVLVVPLPALLVSLAVLVKLPSPFTFLQAQPGDAGWPAERARWLALLALALLAATWLGRDPAARQVLRRSR